MLIELHPWHEEVHEEQARADHPGKHKEQHRIPVVLWDVGFHRSLGQCRERLDGENDARENGPGSNDCESGIGDSMIRAN